MRTSPELDQALGTSVVCKDEGAQLTGSFKLRGAWNALAGLDPAARSRGVITCSSGNFGRALGEAARLQRVRCLVVAPASAPEEKLLAIEATGAELRLHASDEDRAALTAALATAEALRFISPYDDPLVIAGQGTAVSELLDDEPELDAVIVPTSGGGLLVGSALAAHTRDTKIRVFGAEPAVMAKTGRSLRTGRREKVQAAETIADALRVDQPGAVTFPVVQSLADDVVPVSDEEIAAAMRLLWQHFRIRFEPSGAAGLAAVIAGRLPAALGRIGVVLSGANVSSSRFQTIVRDHSRRSYATTHRTPGSGGE